MDQEAILKGLTRKQTEVILEYYALKMNKKQKKLLRTYSRYEILNLLLNTGEKNIKEISEAVDQSFRNTERNIEFLESKNYIKTRKAGVFRYSKITQKGRNLFK